MLQSIRQLATFYNKEESIAEGPNPNSQAASSRKANGSSQASYHQFCRKLNLAHLPTSKDSLILFVAELSQRVSYSTTRSYLSAVRHLHTSKGYGDPLANTTPLDLVLKGAKQLRPGAPDTRMPITSLILRRIKSTLLQDPYNYDHIMLWVACCLEFFAFLRSGELAVPDTKQFDTAWYLTPQDLAFDSEVEPSMLQVHLKGSKLISYEQACTCTWVPQATSCAQLQRW